MGEFGRQGNKTRKVPPAFASGMRGNEKPSAGKEPGEAEQERHARHTGTESGHKSAAEGSLATNDGSEAHGYSELVSQHINGPDENGHHHLNLTTFSRALADHDEEVPGEE